MLRLTAERMKAGLSQTKLAQLADIHPSTLSRLEAGKLHAYPAWRRRLAGALGYERNPRTGELDPDGEGLFETIDTGCGDGGQAT